MRSVTAMVILIALTLTVVVAVVAAIVNLPIDGYHRVRTRHQ